MKNIQLTQEFLDKIVLDELKEYREVMLGNILDYYSPEPHVREDLNRHIMVIAALDILIKEFTVPYELA